MPGEVMCTYNECRSQNRLLSLTLARRTVGGATTACPPRADPQQLSIRRRSTIQSRRLISHVCWPVPPLHNSQEPVLSMALKAQVLVVFHFDFFNQMSPPTSLASQELHATAQFAMKAELVCLLRSGSRLKSGRH